MIVPKFTVTLSLLASLLLYCSCDSVQINNTFTFNLDRSTPFTIGSGSLLDTALTADLHVTEQELSIQHTTFEKLKTAELTKFTISRQDAGINLSQIDSAQVFVSQTGKNDVLVAVNDSLALRTDNQITLHTLRENISSFLQDSTSRVLLHLFSKTQSVSSAKLSTDLTIVVTAEHL